MTSRGELNVIVRQRTGEHYIFIFSDARAHDVLRQLGHFAVNKELSFTWYDVSVVAEHVRRITKRNRRPAMDRQGRGWIDRSA